MIGWAWTPSFDTAMVANFVAIFSDLPGLIATGVGCGFWFTSFRLLAFVLFLMLALFFVASTGKLLLFLGSVGLFARFGVLLESKSFLFMSFGRTTTSLVFWIAGPFLAGSLEAFLITGKTVPCFASGSFFSWKNSKFI